MSDSQDQTPEGLTGEIDFDNLDIGKLRAYAKMLRVVVPRDAKKNDIVQLLKANSRKSNAVILADENTEVGPGYSKILVFKDPDRRATNRPVYVNCNGYMVHIPRGVPVIVPTKIVNALNDAVRKVRVRDPDAAEDSPNAYKDQELMSYPFQILASTPGPDPKPGFERGKQAAYGPRAAFRDLFHRWPKRHELLEAQKEGFIKLTMPAKEPVNSGD